MADGRGPWMAGTVAVSALPPAGHPESDHRLWQGDVRKGNPEAGGRHMMHLGGNFVAGMKTPFMKPEAVNRLLELEGLEPVKEALKAGRGAVYVIMHMGNWEILTQSAAPVAGTKPGALFQPLHNAPL